MAGIRFARRLFSDLSLPGPGAAPKGRGCRSERGSQLFGRKDDEFEEVDLATGFLSSSSEKNEMLRVREDSIAGVDRVAALPLPSSVPTSRKQPGMLFSTDNNNNNNNNTFQEMLVTIRVFRALDLTFLD